MGCMKGNRLTLKYLDGMTVVKLIQQEIGGMTTNNLM